MLTCKEFLAELSEYLDATTDAAVRAKLEQHITLCPECYVMYDTTRKTIEVYKGGMKSCPIPDEVHSRLMAAVERRIADKNAEKA